MPGGCPAGLPDHPAARSGQKRRRPFWRGGAHKLTAEWHGLAPDAIQPLIRTDGCAFANAA